MRLFIIGLAFALLTLSAYAQPQAISYQAVARDGSGTLLMNTNINLRFTLKQGSANGTTVYRETHSVTTDVVGRVSVGIGRGTPLSGTFSTINWGAFPYFLEVELDANSSGNYTSLGASEMLSVPYALYAETSGTVSGGGSGGTITEVGTFLVIEDEEAIAWGPATGTWARVTTASGSLIDGDTNSLGNFLVWEDEQAIAWSKVTGTWTSVLTSSGSIIDEILGDGGNFVIIEDEEAIAWNQNTGVWSRVTTSSGSLIDATLSANGNFLVLEDEEAIAYSKYTGTWTSVTTASGSLIDGYLKAGENFLIYEDEEAIAWNSQTGVWTRITTASGSLIDAIRAGDQ